MSNPGSRTWVAEVMEQVFEELRGLRKAGQAEYAHDDGNAFANFEDDAEETGASREVVLSIFANKHWRGIRAWIRGHRSQREGVKGRINDMLVYLCLLRAMVEQDEVKAKHPEPVPSAEVERQRDDAARTMSGRLACGHLMSSERSAAGKKFCICIECFNRASVLGPGSAKRDGDADQVELPSRDAATPAAGGEKK